MESAKEKDVWPRRWNAGPWLLGFAIWTALGALSALQIAMFRIREAQPVLWPQLTTDRLLDWYTCAIFTPFFFWLVRAVPWDRARWWRPVGIQALVVMACVPIKYFLYVAGVQWLLSNYREVVFGRILLGNFISEVMAFGAMMAVIHAVENNRRNMLSVARAARLEARLAESRLETLTAQLQPHFLFNTLHAVSTLMHRDVEAADTMLARLSDLLRRTLDERARTEIPLGEELDLLDAYLDIARIRFADRLTVDMQIAPGTRAARVPRLILQPLVENALQHGIGSREGRGRITIRSRQEQGRLVLSVSDDGAGGGAALVNNSFPREGIGLSNTRQRLRERYGDAQSLRLSNGTSAGLVVTLEIPFEDVGEPVGLPATAPALSHAAPLPTATGHASRRAG